MGRLSFLALILILQTACSQSRYGEQSACSKFQKNFLKANSKLSNQKGTVKGASTPWLYTYLPIQVKKHFYLHNIILDMPDKSEYTFQYYLSNDVRGNPDDSLILEPQFKTCLNSLSKEDLANHGFTKLKVTAKCMGKCRTEGGKTDYNYDFLYSEIFHTSEEITIKYTIDSSLDVVEPLYPNIKNADAILTVDVFNRNNLILTNSVALVASEDSGH